MVRTALFATAALLAACTTPTETDQAAAPADRDCFNAQMANGFSYIDENHIDVRVSANRKYRLTTMFNARDLDWTQAIAIRSTSAWICTGNGLGVELIGGNPQRTYPVRGIERLPDDAPVQGS
ncbi:MAG: hypothetical protein K2P58_00180 [Hyphomonadaceae bacterium]|nr:hypothetical protein [Hyphomonadaceae bacterium]